jgi:NitT/TauT family transport system substrate-binding protein
VGFADINSLMKFLDQNPGAPVIAVMMIYDKPPFAVVGRKSLGIETPADLEGQGAGRAAARWRMGAVPDLRRRNRHRHGEDHRGTRGLPGARADAGRRQGRGRDRLFLLGHAEPDPSWRAEDDLSVLLMADHGVALYGNAIIVNTDFAAPIPRP